MTARAYGTQPGAGEVPPDTAVRAPSARPGDVGEGGTPHPAACATRAQAGERGGNPGQAARNPSAQPGRGG